MRIFSYENCFASVRGRRSGRDERLILSRLSRRSQQTRKIYFEGGTHSRTARGVYIPATLFDDAVDCRQAETRTACLVFRCEERLEDVRQDVGGHTCSCVLNREHRIGTALHIEAKAWR